MEDNRYQDSNRRPAGRQGSAQGDGRRVSSNTAYRQASNTGAPRRTAQTGTTGTTRRSSQSAPNGSAHRSARTGAPSGSRRTPQTTAQPGTRRPSQAGTQGTTRRTTQSQTGYRSEAGQGTRRMTENEMGRSQHSTSAGNRRPASSKGKPKKNHKPVNPQKAAKKKRRKIVLFIIEIFVLLILLVVFWGVMKARQIQIVTIDDQDVEINEQVKEATETGAMKGYRNIALFGVDSRDGELDKSTRTDTIIIASINQDTKEVKMISILRDTYLNLSTDTYNKANSAYAKGGPKQASAMLNMNLDMNITDFVTIGFDGLIDVIDAVGGIEIDVQENEIPHLNSYQISMVGKQDGTLNAKGEPNYVATEGVDYIPVTTAGLQKLNGLQATAYCRIRYVGNDFARTQRQRTVIEKVAKKAMTLNPATLNNIANAVFPKIATSLDLSEIIELLGGITGYTIGETASFPFDGSVQTGRVRKMSVVIPQDLEYNVKLLHQMFFDEQDYEPSSTVKTCSSKIASDTGVYYSGQ